MLNTRLIFDPRVCLNPAHWGTFTGTSGGVTGRQPPSPSGSPRDCNPSSPLHSQGVLIPHLVVVVVFYLVFFICVFENFGSVFACHFRPNAVYAPFIEATWIAGDFLSSYILYSECYTRKTSLLLAHNPAKNSHTFRGCRVKLGLGAELPWVTAKEVVGRQCFQSCLSLSLSTGAPHVATHGPVQTSSLPSLHPLDLFKHVHNVA